MYPILFRLGEFEITSFGAMVGLAALVGLWLFRRELARSSLPADAVDAGLIGVVGGMVGAKLLWTIEHAGLAPATELLFSRGGLSWYGGLLGGVGAGLAFIAVKGWNIVAVVAAATPALAVGHLLGRIGCFLVGDDYGTPSTLPWAIAFPEGSPPTTVRVHPTQLYEAVGLAALGWYLLRCRAKKLSEHVVLGRYLVLAGALRFAVQFVRVNDPMVLGLSLAHLLSLGVSAVGLAILLAGRARRR
jgi:phosphatidylglycerol---prolipoprotein diacylglyceryl transferase